MYFPWFVCLVCLFAMVVQSQNFQAPKRSMTRKQCGKRLADALSLVCNGNYNRFLSKKDMPFNELLGEDYAYDQQPDEVRWPFLSRQSANALLARNDVYGRHRRGVADECCRKSCSISELRSYCGH